MIADPYSFMPITPYTGCPICGPPTPRGCSGCSGCDLGESEGDASGKGCGASGKGGGASGSLEWSEEAERMGEFGELGE